MLKAVLFDLDGTLLPMDQNVFMQDYFGRLIRRLVPLGYTPEGFLAAMKKGIAAMVTNNGTRTNEEAYWEAYTSVSGKEILNHMPVFERFYNEEFDDVAAVCGCNPQAAELVHSLQRRGIRVILATNPLFPQIATQKRIRWAGLQPEDFEFYTTYEDIGFCKPNPAYYKEVLRRAGLDAANCLMVGNDIAEDMMAGAQAGLRGFLLTDCLINTPGADVNDYPHGSFDELNAYIETLLNQA
ncbi:MAG: HAD family hydrolase [Clostridia bacterium]|nr:HAD family hydrolase [Clostridia bacterium]